MTLRKGSTGDPSNKVDALQPLTGLLIDLGRGRLSGHITEVPGDDPLFPACEKLKGLLDRVELVNREVSGAMHAAVEGGCHRKFIALGVQGSFIPVAPSRKCCVRGRSCRRSPSPRGRWRKSSTSSRRSPARPTF